MNKCIICVIIRCAYKWLFAVGLTGLFLLVALLIILLAINGDADLPKWVEIWFFSSAITLIFSGMLAIVSRWEEIVDYLRDELSCKF